jgi:hypothetical protein
VEAKGEDPTSQVLQAIGAHDMTEKVVRLIIRTTADRESLLKESEIFKALEEAFYVAVVRRDVERPVRVRLGKRDYEEMTPREILKTYLQVKQVSPERAEILLRHADQLLQEVD